MDFKIYKQGRKRVTNFFYNYLLNPELKNTFRICKIIGLKQMVKNVLIKLKIEKKTTTNVVGNIKEKFY